MTGAHDPGAARGKMKSPGGAEERPPSEDPVGESGGKRFTYRKAMAAAGIEPGDKRHSQSIDWAMMWLLEHRPFFAYCFSGIVRKESYDLPTLAVTCRRGRIELIYNPDFVSLHSLRFCVGFLIHELGHVIQGHLADGQRKPGLFRDPLVNVAMDLAVNSLIQAPGDLPKWVLFPSQFQIPRPGVPRDRWSNFPERATWVEYLEMLKDLAEAEGASGILSAGEGEQPVDDNGMPSGGDDHGRWGKEGGCDEPDVVDQAVRGMVQSAMATMESKGGAGRGTIPGGLMALIDKIIGSPSVPFSRLLKSFIASRFDVKRRPAATRLSRRRATPPGSRSSKKISILWCRDTSGSVSDEELALSYNELRGLASGSSGVSILVQDFDHGLQGQAIDLDRSPVTAAARVKGRGGTDFSAPLDLAAETRPDVCIITTDGYAPYPEKPPGVPVMWILTHDGFKPPWGFVVRLPSLQEIKSGHRATVERWLGQK
jgi:predicted metal-dependent peptidase